MIFSSLPLELMESTDLESDPVGFMYYCVSRRCQLCRFKICRNDVVIASVDGQLSLEFPHDSVNHLDENLGAYFCICSAFCRHYDRLVPGYHSACLAYASSEPPPDVLRIITNSYEPDQAEDKRRYNRIQRLLTDKLRQVYRSLPLELGLLIAGGLVRECAISMTEELRQARQSLSYDLDVSGGLSANYIFIDGVRYIASLSTELGQISRSTQLLSVDEVSSVQVLYVLEDHLGIRQLLFTDSQERVKVPFVTSGQGFWWRTIPLLQKLGKLITTSDGLKLRSITPASIPNVETVTWAKPMAVSEISKLRVLPFAPDSALQLDYFRMVALDCNEPRVTGYSACWAGNLMMLHAHRDGEKLTFYEDLGGSRAIWIYMPVDADELVSEILARRGRQYAHMGLMLRTTKGKQMTIGMHISGRLFIQNGNKQPRWIRLCSLPRDQSQVFFNLSDRGLHRLYIPKKQAAHEQPLPVRLPAYYPKTHGISDYFYSAERLEQVAEITPCQINLHAYSPIVGLLLRYVDGRRACVGEFRMNSVGKPLRVDSSQKLHLRFAFADNIPFHVAELDVCHSHKGGRHWLSLPWKGLIEWWFTHGHCKVYYEGSLLSPI